MSIAFVEGLAPALAFGKFSKVRISAVGEGPISREGCSRRPAYDGAREAYQRADTFGRLLAFGVGDSSKPLV
jgi:hypothetical protein